MTIAELAALCAVATAAGIPLGWLIKAKRMGANNHSAADLQRTLIRIETRLALLPTREEMDRATQREEAATILKVIDLLREDIAAVKKAGRL